MLDDTLRDVVVVDGIPVFSCAVVETVSGVASHGADGVARAVQRGRRYLHRVPVW